MRQVDGISYQRYLCRPTNGDTPHTLRSEMPGSTGPSLPPPSPPEPCPKHPGSRVVRHGKRRSRSGVERQLYLCHPLDGSASHRFRPQLSRLAVDHGETCPECAAQRGVNAGETTVAKGHRFTSRVVAAALDRLAAGDSYGSVAVWARGKMDAHADHAAFDFKFVGKTATAQRKNAWRLAADWTETFSPVLWSPWAERAREQVLTALDGPTKDRPIVTLMLDDIPVFSRSIKGVGQRQRFSVLAASESFLDRDTGERVSRLRLLRAFPNHGVEAYKLVLAELDYVPDIILADGGTGIGGATQWLTTNNPDRPFLSALSAYHLRNQIRRQFTDLARPYGFHPGDLIERLEDFTFCSSAAAWQAWWHDYEARLRAQGIPESAWPRRWVKKMKPRVDEMMEALDGDRVVPRSTGALESVLFKIVKPSLEGRAQGFGNLERTNRLLDLMVLRANGEFDNLGRVADQLSRDARTHDGYAPVVRQITDVRSYRSLLDAEVPDRLAKELGL